MVINELEEIFTKIYLENLWNSTETVSGMCSEIEHTKEIIKELPILLKKYNIKSMLDIPCGDWNWMQNMDLSSVKYIGADIVKPLIEKNKSTYPHIDWRILDITTDDLPKVDLVFVRDCFGHLSNENVQKSIENIQRSGSKYLLSTSFTRYTGNNDVENGGWKPINLMVAPFNLKPIYLINEEFNVAHPTYNDRCMILFPLDF